MTGEKSTKPWFIRSTRIFCEVVLDYLREFHNSTFHWQSEGTSKSDEVILPFVGCERVVKDSTQDLLVDAECACGVVGLLLGCFHDLSFLFHL